MDTLGTGASRRDPRIRSPASSYILLEGTHRSGETGVLLHKSKRLAVAKDFFWLLRSDDFPTEGLFGDRVCSNRKSQSDPP